MTTNVLHQAMLGQFAAEIDPSMDALLCEARCMRAASGGKDERLRAAHWEELQILALTVAGVVREWEAIGVGFDELDGRPGEAILVDSSCRLLVMLLQHNTPTMSEVDQTLESLWTAAMDV